MYMQSLHADIMQLISTPTI